jgi:hypothetical protein
MTATFAGGLLARLAPFVTPQTDPTGAHAIYLTALAQCFEETFGIVMDQGFPDDPDWVPGYGPLLDVDACPTAFLPFLAQFVGATIPVGASDAVARQVIRAESGMQRGTGFAGTYDSGTIPDGGAIVSAAQRNLSGTQSVTLLERLNAAGEPDAYAFVLVVKPGEVVSLSQLIADVSAAKPGGVMFAVTESDAWVWDEALHVWAADSMTWDASATTRP